MEQKQTLPSPFAPVELQRLQTPNGADSSRLAVVLDPKKTAKEVGIVSNDYNLVPNKDVVQVAEHILKTSGQEVNVINTKFNGKRFTQRYQLTTVEGEVRVGDVVAVTLDVLNSYDGTTKLGLEFNAVRLVCSNGMMLSFMLGGFRFKHWGDRNFDDELRQATRQLAMVGGRLHNMLLALRDLTTKRMKRVDVQKFFRETNLPITTQAKVFNAIEEDNAWGIYNAATDVLTRQESFGADQLNRRVSQWFIK